MLDIMFFIKTALLTAVIVALLQMKVGESSLETQAHQFIQSSRMMQPLHDVAESGVFLIRKGIKWSSEQINSRWHRGKAVKGTSQDASFWHRSEAYEQEQAKKKEQSNEASAAANHPNK